MGFRVQLLGFCLDGGANGDPNTQCGLLVDFRSLLYPNFADLLPNIWIVFRIFERWNMASVEFMAGQRHIGPDRNLVNAKGRKNLNKL